LPTLQQFGATHQRGFELLDTAASNIEFTQEIVRSV
jgi:hypothetical protein